jgi:hypothetical protein
VAQAHIDSSVNMPLQCGPKHNRGATEVFYEAARASLSTRAKDQVRGLRGDVGKAYD